MAFDATAELLTGARILRAERRPPWLNLWTDKGLVAVAGGRVRLDLRCPKCDEERLVEIVEDRRGPQGVCAVCGHSWVLRPTDGGFGKAERAVEGG